MPIPVEKLRDYFFKGAVMVVMVTPFKRGSEEVDLDALRQLTEFLLEHRGYGPLVLTPTGSTGEFYALNDEEWRRVVETVVEIAGGKVPVVAGASHAGAKPIVERLRFLEDIGADGAMVVLPYYHIPVEEGLYQHYRKVCESTGLGIVIYNNPHVSKIYMRPHLLKKLVETVDNVVALKENTPSIATLNAQIKAVGDKIAVLNGIGEWWFGATVLLGVRGFVSGYANFMPRIVLDLLKAGLDGDYAKVRELMDRFWVLDQFVAKMNNKYGPTTSILPEPYVQSYMIYAVIKAAMEILGLKGGSVRLPLINLRDEDRKELERILFEVFGLEKIG